MYFFLVTILFELAKNDLNKNFEDINNIMIHQDQFNRQVSKPKSKL